MISVIVSSYKQEDFVKFSKSLDETIGLPYELVKIENPNRFDLSHAYNLGAIRANFDYLVFVHEDVTFDSNAWGNSFIKLFEKEPSLGIIGVAGALKKSPLPTGWGTGTGAFDRIHLNQSTGSGKKEFQSTKIGKALSEPIKVLDGVFIATTKKIWEEIQFDESLTGFHLYDIDFSLRVTQKYLGLLSYEILLTHYSTGNYDSDWLEKTLEYHGRKDKQVLFDSDDSYFSNSRRAWYKALTFSLLPTKLRKEYLNKMGVDLVASVHAFCFRFPSIGKFIFKVLALFGL